MRYNLGCALAVPAPKLYISKDLLHTHISWQCEPSNEFFSVITERQTIPEIHSHTYTQLKRQKQKKLGMKCNRIKRALIRKTEPNLEANPCGPHYKYYVCVCVFSLFFFMAWHRVLFSLCVFIIAQIRRTWKWGKWKWEWKCLCLLTVLKVVAGQAHSSIMNDLFSSADSKLKLLNDCKRWWPEW